MPTPYRRIPPLQTALLVPLAPLEVDREESSIAGSPQLSHGLRLPRTHTELERGQDRRREGRMQPLVARIIRHRPQRPRGALERLHLEDIGGLRQRFAEAVTINILTHGMRTPIGQTHRVLIILRKAPIEVRRVTMCARPVHTSVQVMQGQENARKSSKVENRWPHERSYLNIYMSTSERVQSPLRAYREKRRAIGCPEWR
jgi:hypothetical protein